MTEPKQAQKKEKGLSARILEYLIRQQPDIFFGFLRNTIPNLALPKNGPVFITRFLDVQEALSRPDVFQVTYAPMMDPSVGPFMLGRDCTTINQRDKGIMRALIQRDDLPKIRSTVASLVNSAVEAQLENKQIEVVSAISRMVPVQLTGEYFGFPGPDPASMFRWSRATQYDMFHNTDGDPRIHEDNIRAGHEMKAYLEELLPRRLSEIEENPELDDIFSRLLKSKFVDSIHFDQARIITNIMGTLVGGIETTSQAIVQILDQFFKRPDIMEEAVDAARNNDHDMMFVYCWEALRFNPINPFVVRRCASDYRIASGSLRSKLIHAGRTVLICTRSAMQDGRQLEVPRAFCIDRPRYHYMHMGYGLHTCLGDQVSGVQIPEIVKRLLLLPNLRPVGEIDFKGGPFPESYTVAFD